MTHGDFDAPSLLFLDRYAYLKVALSNLPKDVSIIR